MRLAGWQRETDTRLRLMFEQDGQLIDKYIRGDVSEEALNVVLQALQMAIEAQRDLNGKK